MIFKAEYFEKAAKAVGRSFGSLDRSISTMERTINKSKKPRKRKTDQTMYAGSATAEDMRSVSRAHAKNIELSRKQI